MDPTETLRLMFSALESRDHAEFLGTAADLAGWIRRGGFAPDTLAALRTGSVSAKHPDPLRSDFVAIGDTFEFGEPVACGVNCADPRDPSDGAEWTAPPGTLWEIVDIDRHEPDAPRDWMLFLETEIPHPDRDGETAKAIAAISAAHFNDLRPYCSECSGRGYGLFSVNRAPWTEIEGCDACNGPGATDDDLAAVRFVRDLERDDPTAQQFARELLGLSKEPEPEPERCPVCGEPGHPTETDDDGRHPDCVAVACADCGDEYLPGDLETLAGSPDRLCAGCAALELYRADCEHLGDLPRDANGWGMDDENPASDCIGEALRAVAFAAFQAVSWAVRMDGWDRRKARAGIRGRILATLRAFAPDAFTRPHGLERIAPVIKRVLNLSPLSAHHWDATVADRSRRFYACATAESGKFGGLDWSVTVDAEGFDAWVEGEHAGLYYSRTLAVREARCAAMERGGAQ